MVAAFSLAVYNGGDMSEALKIARSISRTHDADFNELLEPCTLDHEELKDEIMHLDTSIRTALSHMTDEYHVSKAMAAFPKAPKSDLVIGHLSPFYCVWMLLVHVLYFPSVFPS